MCKLKLRRARAREEILETSSKRENRNRVGVYKLNRFEILGADLSRYRGRGRVMVTHSGDQKRDHYFFKNSSYRRL